MITKDMVVEKLSCASSLPKKQKAHAFAPANIALIKYWGKRNRELNLPVTSSLSLSLEKGTHTTITVADRDSVTLNGKEATDAFSKRLFSFIDLFRSQDVKLCIETQNDIPTAAGFASSSSGFAAVTLALNELFGWNKDLKTLSILARFGSGSASRSLYTGFVLWHKGVDEDGLDSFSEPVGELWNDLKIDLLTVSSAEKPIDSRSAMNRTVESSPLYSSWPSQVAHDLPLMQKAIQEQNFELLGSVAEQNALAMHATMIASSPSILYWLPETITWMQKIWKLRREGLSIYFTMDAGPNIKVLTRKNDFEYLKNSL